MAYTLRSLVLGAAVACLSWPGPLAAQTEAPRMSDACQQRIAEVRTNLNRLDESERLGLGHTDNRDSPLGEIGSMVDQAQSALDEGNEERCASLVGDAERALAGLE